jgi:transcriptional regulator with XRE-family HTH domain
MKELNLEMTTQLQIKLLETEFEKRKQINKKFSLRKFSEEAGVDTSTMSQYLKGKRKLTETAFLNIMRKLRVDDEVLDKYKQDLVEYEVLKGKQEKVKTHWYYYAILETTFLIDHVSTPEWVSKRLNLDLETTKQAIDDLIDIGAMVVIQGKYKDTLGDVSFSEDINYDEEVGREHQKQLLHKAEESIYNNAGDIKDHTSSCFSFDTALIPEVKKRIAEFKSGLGHFISSNSRYKNEVYSLQINLTALTKPIKEESEK